MSIRITLHDLRWIEEKFVLAYALALSYCLLSFLGRRLAIKFCLTGRWLKLI
jgi:hypothetical protein